MWLSVVEVSEISVQFASKPAMPTFRLYCHLLSVPVPVTDEDSVNSPLPVGFAVGFVGLPGLVSNAEVAANSLDALQPLSLYALYV